MSTPHLPPVHRRKDGRPWRIADQSDVAWIQAGTTIGPGITSGIPPVFESYATVVLPDPTTERQALTLRLLHLLRRRTPDQAWLLGFLETGSDDVVFPDAPRVTLYTGWGYVVVEAGPHEAALWRAESRSFRRPGPGLAFPLDRSWLVTHLWDDEWVCVGGPATLVDRLLAELGPAARQVRVDDADATPPGYTAM